MPGLIGSRLRSIRAKWGLSLRDVEERSTRLAKQTGIPAYQISASWLARVEKEEHELTVTKLVSLAAIYNLSFEDVLGDSKPDNGSLSVSNPVNAPNATLLMRGTQFDAETTSGSALLGAAISAPEQTSLLPLPDGSGLLPTSYRRAILGRNDRSLDPIIRPGTILEIDTQKKTIAPRRHWTYEIERPIYVLLTRTGYVSGWCELDPDAVWLTLIPHPLSRINSQRWRFKKDVEVIGKVVAVYMRLDSNT